MTGTNEYYFWRNVPIMSEEDLFPYDQINDALKRASFPGEIILGPTIGTDAEGKPKSVYLNSGAKIGIGLYVREDSLEKYGIDKERSLPLFGSNVELQMALASRLAARR